MYILNINTVGTQKKKEVTALGLLKKSKSVVERAESFFTSIKRNMKRDVIDKLEATLEGYQDELFHLEDFSLDTNKNAGKHSMTRQECEDRFKKIFDIKYKIKLVELELKEKQAYFDQYFSS